ncbi:MAG: zf-HC2 domain-containing protein, partial [Gemmatimonadales bacterium]|nr:zf-HC2 domain-containing protein [Gemmatimonadales bacterium]
MSHVDDGALHAYLDGEVTAAERAEIEAHLAGCAACRTRLDEERALIGRASEVLGRAQPPLQTRRSRRGARRWVLPLTWAATVVLAVGLGYSLRAPESTPVAMSDQATTVEESEAPAAQPRPPRSPVPATSRPVDLAARRDTARDTIIAEAAAAVVAIREQAQALR